MDKYIDLLKNLPEDVQEKAKECKTRDELFALLKSEKVDLSKLKANGPVELDDDDLDMVSGGCCEGSGAY